MNTIYLDASATTQMDKEVFREMQKFFKNEYGNAGSMHHKGLVVSNALMNSRKRVAEIFNAKENEIIFTGSGTESINLAIKGYALKNKSKGNHIITTTIEHHSVLESLEYLRKQGFEITKVGVEKNGIVDPKKIKSAIRENTILISVMYANNEIGTIQPINEISKIAKKKKIVFHTDACQAVNSEDLNINADLISINASKIYGPKGVGALYKKEDIQLEPLIHGGGQEFNTRGGTENIPNIIGLAKALELTQKNKKDYSKLEKLRDYMIENLLKIEDTILNGDKENRVPNNINITFLNIEGESILLKLDNEGICASSGSACTSKSLDASHVILATGQSEKVAHGSIRFSLTKYTTKKELDRVIKLMKKIVKELRGISPVHLKKDDLE
ncbi:cysteine desulfurase [Candidatus Woesearchaeota archaeon]|jgi:cysteine desulfurase|nr:cysteine desulfurase [Candidatus Woesearchaeota archaeon]MBT4835396.1 cysteine desulfurase [Candidatus Woesearchaeota archaeon]MBT6735272.1 cysteine desulfurase [Candidatus Woesearchaeota archaeon]MBT7170116.1 cysteine desulfurase [Candidatus Woesearchaeota archaeon]MBT7474506.1 cysteine desulfurase [Candidatus Woesearchaeota archaeon]